MDNICYADFHYLNIKYDIIFYIKGELNEIKKLLIETTLFQYIDLNKLRYFS